MGKEGEEGKEKDRGRKKGSNELIVSTSRLKFKCYFTVMPSTIICLPAPASIAEVCSSSHDESRRVYSQSWFRLMLELKGTLVVISEVYIIMQDRKLRRTY